MYKNFHIIAAPLCAVFIAFVMMAWMDYRNSNTILTTAILENQILIGNEVSRTVVHAINNIKEISKIVSHLPPILPALQNPQVPESNRLELHNLLIKLVEESAGISNISIFTKYGDTLTDSANFKTNIAFRTYFKKAQQGEATLEPIISEQTEKVALCYILPVMDKNECIGIIRASFDLFNLSKVWLTILPKDKGYLVMIANRQGLIISCSCPLEHELRNIYNMPVQTIFQTSPGTLVPFVDNKTERLGMYLPITDTDLSIVISVNTYNVHASSTKLFIETLVYNTIITLLVMIIMFYMLNKLIHTIRRLEIQNRIVLIKANEDLEKTVAERTQDLQIQHQYLISKHQTMMNVLETSPMGISISDTKGHPLYINSATKQLLACGDQTVAPVHHYQDMQDRVQISLWLAEGKTIQHHPISMIDLQGNQHQILLSALLIDYENQIAELLWFFDITERCNIEKDLEAERTLLRTIFDAIPDMVFYKSPTGKYLASNSAFAAFVGKTTQEVIGTTDVELFHLNHTEAIAQLELDQGIMQGQQAVRIEESVTDITGLQLQLETIKAPCFDDRGKALGLLGICRDITERKAMEQEIIAAREEAQLANRAKSDFIANMSHEIRTPMNGIMGLSHLVLQSTKLSIQDRDYVRKIDGSAKSLLRIINDILDFSKIEAGKLEMEIIPFNLTHTLEQVIQPLMPLVANKNLELLFDLETDLPIHLLGDPVRLGQILLNLTSNAIKFTPKGSIVIRIETVGFIDPEHVTLCFKITDTGIGIEPQYLSRLFESFSQADSSITRRYGGTGLGLAISKRLVHMMDGKITVTSVVGQGTTFTFTANFGIFAQSVNNKVKHNELVALRILVADDNLISRHILHDYFESFGVNIDEAENGLEAVELFKQSLVTGKPYDAIVLDWKMPEMTGLETSQQIHEIGEGSIIPKILLVTAHERELILPEARIVGISNVLSKPITPSSLYDALVNILQSNQEDSNYVESTAMVQEVTLSQPLHDKRILLAEDNEINQLVATEILLGLGATVTIAANGFEVIKYALTEPFDIILMDIQMPEMDGMEATYCLRKEPSLDHTPIIAMTAHAMTGDLEKSLRAGMQAHITKPIDPQVLCEVLVHWLNSKVDVVH